MEDNRQPRFLCWTSRQSAHASTSSVRVDGRGGFRASSGVEKTVDEADFSPPALVLCVPGERSAVEQVVEGPPLWAFVLVVREIAKLSRTDRYRPHPDRSSSRRWKG